MNNLKRRKFLKKATLLVVGNVIITKNLFSQPVQSAKDDKGLTIINKDAIIDLHCHPAMKMYLLNKKMWQHQHPRPGPNILTMQESADELGTGYVKGMLAAHYLVEASVGKEWDLLKNILKVSFLKNLLHSITDKIEQESDKNFDQVNSMMDMLEYQLKVTNSRQDKVKFVIAKSYREFIEAINKGCVPVAHAIEGAHALGRDHPISRKRTDDLYKEQNITGDEKAMVRPKGKMLTPGGDPSKYLDHLQKYADRGVCLITLSHFFPNDIAYPVDGISADTKKTLQMAWQYTPDKDHGLTDVGKVVVARMLDIGVIVDITHTTPAVRQDVFAINKQRPGAGKKLRPLVFTHVGAQKIYEYYDQGKYPYYNFYNVSDTEIKQIEECDGVIGVIPENFWLVGSDTHMDRNTKFKYVDGIRYMLETMKYINSKTANKDFSHVGIGTDFDGLADNPADLYKASQLVNLISAMQADKDFSPEAIRRITSENSLRLLKYGWGA